MKISDEKWNEIIAVTRWRVERWNARAAERNLPDRFSCDVVPTTHLAVLITTHQPEHGPIERKAVAREIISGEVRSTKLRKGRVSGLTTRTPDPKAWGSLAVRSASEIVVKLKLGDFLHVLGSNVNRIESTEQSTI
jgi:hypothetical protein